MTSLFPEDVPPGLTLLRGAAAEAAPALLAWIADVAAAAPFRHMRTRRGHALSAAMTNAGPLGWLSDSRGYRYAPADPLTGAPWPPLPPLLLDLARGAAEAAGFPGFTPDACLINRYAVGARMGPHQDRDEAELAHPIVSVSLGLPVVFQFGPAEHAGPLPRLRLEHGDVAVWGGDHRLARHGVLPLKAGDHPLTGPFRYNLTLRRAG